MTPGGYHLFRREQEAKDKQIKNLERVLKWGFLIWHSLNLMKQFQQALTP